MQIREKGRKLLCIRTKYVPEKKRTVGVTVASQESYMTTVTNEVRQQLTEEEIVQLKTYLSERAERENTDRMQNCLSMLAGWMDRAAEALDVDSLRDGLSPEQADRIWQAHERLSKSLRRNGFRKPKPQPKPAAKRGEDQPGLPLGDGD